MRLEVALLELDAKRLEGMELREVLRAAYDAIAAEVTRKDQSDEALKRKIPERVLEESFRLGWLKRVEEHPQEAQNVARETRRRWLPDTSGWLSRYEDRRSGQPVAPPGEPKTMAVAGIEVLETWWTQAWLPIFAGRIQAWRAKILAGAPPVPDRKKTFPRRAEWFHARLLECGLSVTEWARRSALTEKTVRRILQGLPVNAQSLAAAVDGLNWNTKIRKVSPDEVPNA